MSAEVGQKPAHVVKIIESQMPADRQASAVEVSVFFGGQKCVRVVFIL